MKSLSNPKEIHNMDVNLPNGQHVQITHTGSVKLSDAFILQNVLSIPDFHYNLISIGAFIKTSKRIMKLCTDKCVV